MITHFTEQELTHYRRHLQLPAVGLAGQQRLKNARVLYIGAGGLGSAALPYLVAAGVGTVGVVDDDKVEAVNLQRQILYGYGDIGKKKVFAAQQRLQNINPAIRIVPHDVKLTSTNALEIINQYDVIADGSDNFATRYIVNDACFHLKKPNVYASISQFDGRCSVFTAAQGPCYRCLFPHPPAAHVIPNCAEGGVLGVLPGVMGSIQATEVIKLILGIGQALIGKLLVFDALTMNFKELNVARDAECCLCTYQQEFNSLSHHNLIDCAPADNAIAEISVRELKRLHDNQADFLLLDVREQHEYATQNLNGILIPLNELPGRVNELDKNKNIIVHCRSGNRSRQAVKILQAQGFVNVKNLAGGIIAWLQEYPNKDECIND